MSIAGKEPNKVKFERMNLFFHPELVKLIKIERRGTMSDFVSYFFLKGLQHQYGTDDLPNPKKVNNKTMDRQAFTAAVLREAIEHENWKDVDSMPRPRSHSVKKP